MSCSSTLNETQNEMKISMEKLEEIFKLLPYPVYIWKKVEHEFILIYYNMTVEYITEGKIERYLGIKASELYKDQPEILDDINRCFDEKTKISREMKYTVKTTGIEKILDVIYQVISPNLVMVLTEDITEKKEAEQELKESEELFRKIAENTFIGLNILQDEKVIFSNEAHSNITGYTIDEMKNWKPKEYIERIHPDYRELVLTQISKHYEMNNKLVSLIEFPFYSKKGALKWVITNTKSIYYKNRPAVLTTIIDITEKKKIEEKLKESEEKYRTLTEQSLMGIAIAQNNKIKYINDTYSKIFGYTIQEIEQWTIEDLKKIIHPDDFEFFLDQFQRKQKGEADIITNYQYRAFKKNGDLVWVDNYSTSIIYEGRTGNFITVVDITDRKKAEEALKFSEQKYREAYNKAEFYKDLFAHDMNNILQVILGSNHLSLAYLDDIENRKNIEEMLRMIDKQVQRGTNLITNIRKLSQLEETETHTQPTEVMAILNKVRNHIIETFHRQEVSIKIENLFSKIFVQANELLKDVFENILNNAIQHNINQNIEILIKISKEQKKGINYCKLEFIDNGRGIANEMKEMIFKRDYREEQKGKGMGLGLSLVKKIMESYNGEIRVEDRIQGDYSKGSNFIVLIPEGE